MLLFSILLGCPAEQLGVELPEGGPQAISQEDLQRDTFGLRKEDPLQFWLHRMDQMHATVSSTGDKWACVTIGGGGRRLLAPWPVDVETAVAAAALISVAKGWDGEEKGRLELCIGEPPPVEGTLKLGPWGPGPLEGDPLHSGSYDPARSLESLSYVEMQQKAVQLWRLSRPSE